MNKSNEYLDIKLKTGKENQVNLNNAAAAAFQLVATARKRLKLLPIGKAAEKQNSNLKERLLKKKEVKTVKNSLTTVNLTNQGRLQDQISNASTIGKNQFNSTTNSLHFEKNVVVLKNSKFLFSRLGWLAQEAELPSTNNTLSPLREINTLVLTKEKASNMKIQNINPSDRALDEGGNVTNFESEKPLSPQNVLQAAKKKSLNFKALAGKTEKINYYNTYKTQLQNYIIEKYKLIASLKAEEDLGKVIKQNKESGIAVQEITSNSVASLTQQKESKKSEEVNANLQNMSLPQSRQKKNQDLITSAAKNKSEELKKKINLIEQIRVKNLLKLLGAYAKNIVKYGSNYSDLATAAATSQLNSTSARSCEATRGELKPINPSARALKKNKVLAALPKDQGFKWNEKVEKKRLDNIKKGTLLPKNILQYIAAAISSKTTLIPTNSNTRISEKAKTIKEARLRQYLNLISNTNIGVNLAIPTSNQLLLNQPCFNNSLNNNNVAQDLRISLKKTNTINTSGETGQVLALPNFIYPAAPAAVNKIRQNKGLLLTYNKIISYNFLSRPNNAVSNQATIALANNTTSRAASAAMDVSAYAPNINRNIAAALPLSKENMNNLNFKRQSLSEKVFIEDLYKLLFYYFKSIYCLIGKPVIQFSPDKITINLFYFLNIPKKKVFKLFAIHYLNFFKDKYIRRVINKNYISEKEKLKNRNRYSSEFIPLSTIQRREAKGVRLPFIKFKYSRSISRLKSKNHFFRSLLFNLRKFNLALVYFRKFKIISKILSNKFNKPIEFNLIRLHKPYLDSNILVNLLQLIVKNKKRKPRVAINKIYSKNKISAPAMQGRLPATASSLPLGYRVAAAINKKGYNLTESNLKVRGNKITSYLSGLSIYINGRLMREPILPRITTKKFESGASATGKVNYLDVSSITKKNRKGAYTIKIKTGQNLF